MIHRFCSDRSTSAGEDLGGSAHLVLLLALSISALAAGAGAAGCSGPSSGGSRHGRAAGPSEGRQSGSDSAKEVLGDLFANGRYDALIARCASWVKQGTIDSGVVYMCGVLVPASDFLTGRPARAGQGALVGCRSLRPRFRARYLGVFAYWVLKALAVQRRLGRKETKRVIAVVFNAADRCGVSRRAVNTEVRKLYELFK